MNDLEALKSLTDFLKENVANKFKFKKPPKYELPECGLTDKEEENLKNNDLVNPAVYSGWVPPKNFLDSYGYDIPGIIVMLDDGTDANEETQLNFRLKIITYDPGLSDENGKITPNAKGFNDLLNIIMKIRLEFQLNPVINEKITINKPIQWNMDEEQNYPYWSANVKFNISLATLKTNIEQYFR